MKYKIAELDGDLLNAAVAKAEGWQRRGTAWARPTRVFHSNGPPTADSVWSSLWGWSTDWQHGGPIIERERIETMFHPEYPGSEPWHAHVHGKPPWSYGGPTPLIAAMRCYVASKFGEEVELP